MYNVNIAIAYFHFLPPFYSCHMSYFYVCVTHVCCIDIKFKMRRVTNIYLLTFQMLFIPLYRSRFPCSIIFLWPEEWLWTFMQVCCFVYLKKPPFWKIILLGMESYIDIIFSSVFWLAPLLTCIVYQNFHNILFLLLSLDCKPCEVLFNLGS